MATAMFAETWDNSQHSKRLIAESRSYTNKNVVAIFKFNINKGFLINAAVVERKILDE
jgi:hypothetical protein